MAHIDNHRPGAFCWIELGTSDQQGARKFYSSLFGWSLMDETSVPGGAYDMFMLEGRFVGAGYQLRPDQQGVPPHWMSYIAVESADAAATKATSLGGKVHMGPFDVDVHGRMAVIQDPTGAMFCVWQPKQNPGIGISGVEGTLCWADLATRDVPAAKAFYEGLFGWTISTSPNDASGYLHIQNGEDYIGGIPPSQYMNPNSPPHWLVYFFVKDCAASAAKAKALGARLYMEPRAIEGVGTMAIMADPQGAVSALFTSARKS